MWSSLSNQYKCYALWGITLVLSVIIYTTLISSIFDKIDQRDEMIGQLNAIQNASTHIKQLEQEIKKADKLLGSSSAEFSSFQQELLSIVSRYCKKNKLVLRDFPEPRIEKKETFSIETNVFEVSGKFKNLVQLVYLFEQRQKIGKVASVAFHKKKDIINRSEYLSALIYIQNIRKNE